jgi:8-oxo-dGTP pyrophosphatase MutT (NUDIX family)
MSQRSPLGIIHHDALQRKTDYLYRVSLKGLVRNAKNEILVVKESGRTWWDLPGGGMDHGEDFKAAIAREMKEEVNLSGEFTYRIIAADTPAYVKAHDFWQLRLIFEVIPDTLIFSPGEDGDEMAFMKAEAFKSSEFATERKIYDYALRL